MSNLSTLKSFIDMDNIASEYDFGVDEEAKQQLLDKYGQRVLLGYNEDLSSCSEWLEDVKKVEELTLLSTSKKNYPLPNSANIKYPLITKACYEFSSRTYPEILKDGKVVKGRVIGIDINTSDKERQDRVERVTSYMNYQLLYENEDWEMELDQLLNRLALIGFICKKSYFDPVRRMIKSEICDPNDLIINSNVKSLKDARRVSHVIHLRLNDLIENMNADIFCRKPVEELLEQHAEDELDPVIDVIEQHTYLDLDEDKYAEPYIVTVLKNTGQVLRIAPRFSKDSIKSKGDKVKYINAKQHFTDYHFLVSPKGKFQSVGFGILMLHLNETINTILNQLVDAGQLANLQGGYKDSRLKNLKTGDSLHDPGEWINVKSTAGVSLKDGIMPINYKEPSNVLFQLLGLLIEAGKDLSSSSEVMTGASSADNAKSGAVMALIQEGLKVFTSIQKRIYRSLTSEFRKVFELDGEFLDPEVYYNIVDDKKAVFQKDFDREQVDILPTADPNLSSELQRASRNQILMAAQQLPGTDPIKLTKLLLENSNLGIPVEEIMVPEDAPQPPNPELIKIQADIQSQAEDKKLKAQELDLRAKELALEAIKTQFECEKIKADTILSLAKAEGVDMEHTLKDYQFQLDAITKQVEMMVGAAQFSKENLLTPPPQIGEMTNEPTGPAMAPPPSDQAPLSPPPGA